MEDDQMRIEQHKKRIIDHLLPKLFPGASNPQTFEDCGIGDRPWILRFTLGSDLYQAEFPLDKLDTEGPERDLEDILQHAKLVPYPPKRR